MTTLTRSTTRRLVGLALALALAGGACSSASPEPSATGPRDQLTGSPVPQPAADGDTSPAPGPTSSTSPSPSPTPTESPSPTGPTDTDRARFVADYDPAGARDLEHVAVDLDGDDERELVFSYVRGEANVSRVDVAWWQGSEYAVRWSGDGGRAERLDETRIGDVNQDGHVEVALFQVVGSAGESLSLWRSAGPGTQALEALVARGGCHDGSHTYGAAGAELRDTDGDGVAEIAATCDDSPLPPAAWSTDIYVWRDGAYHFDHKRLSGEE